MNQPAFYSRTWEAMTRIMGTMATTVVGMMAVVGVLGMRVGMEGIEVNRAPCNCWEQAV
jgi:hypothetical protein